MNAELTELLKSFSTFFPEIDFSSVDSGYNQVERLIIPHIKNLNKKQWEVILSYSYSQLFQDGIPHISWNTDRHEIFNELIKEYKLEPTKVYSETWYEVYVYYIDLGCVKLELTLEEPRSFDGSTHRHIKIIKDEEKIPVQPTHIAIKLSVKRGRAYISDQFFGTLDNCTAWVAKNGDKSNPDYCKILKI